MQILIDHNMAGLARLLFAMLQQDGWADLLELKFVYFAEINLSSASKDSEIWRVAQSQGMLVLTDNRNDEDETSLTAVIERENVATSLPVITVANVKRLREAEYRRLAALRLAEIVMYLENHLGTGRLFIP